jgi:hypothetical protein
METTAVTNGSKSLVDIEHEALSISAEMNAIVITDQATYDIAVDKRTAASTWLKNAREFFKGMKDPAYAAWKKICSNENLVCDPVDAQLKQINGALVKWDQEQERLRRIEQQRLADVARREAEEQRLADAIELEKQGAPAEAVEAVISAPVEVFAPVVAAPTYERSKQVVYRDNWGGQCDDLFKLVQAVAKDKSKLGLLQVNQTALNQMAKALKESFAIPGCRAVNNKVAASGRG